MTEIEYKAAARMADVLDRLITEFNRNPMRPSLGPIVQSADQALAGWTQVDKRVQETPEPPPVKEFADRKGLQTGEVTDFLDDLVNIAESSHELAVHYVQKWGRKFGGTWKTRYLSSAPALKCLVEPRDYNLSDPDIAEALVTHLDDWEAEQDAWKRWAWDDISTDPFEVEAT